MVKFVVFEVLLASLPFLSAAQAAPSPNQLEARDYELVEIQVDASMHDVEFFTFVTRPDLDAPRLDVTVYNESALAPGYFFVSPYGIVDQTDNDKAYVGPHIYDHAGNLVWSGAPYFDGYGTFDFKVSSVHGRDMITAIHPHGNHSVILDNTYNLYRDVDTGINKDTLNMHAFSVVDNGTRALYLTRELKRTSSKNSNAVDFHGRCNVEFTGFEERILATNEVTFQWSPENRIGLDESSLYIGQVIRDCFSPFHPWDYLHMNSVQKLPDGDYLLSGRRTYALYKISGKTGEILWRFGGKHTDFDFDGHFSGQHDAQCHFQNSTHMLITMLDNASGPGWPRETNAFSRGLVVWLNTESMTAEQVRTVDHPYEEYAVARGNFQTLPNGNSFLSWQKDALQTEHTPDGQMILEASFPSGLKTYRAFKFPWVGRPSDPPVVHSQTIEVGTDLVTAVHVSWNGDTEVAYWSLFKTNADASVVVPVASVERDGFETALTYAGAASFVIVEGLDKDGNRLGVSPITKTIGWTGSQLHPAAVKEAQWLQAHPEVEDFKAHPGTHGALSAPLRPTQWHDGMDSVFRNPLFTFFCGIAFALSVMFPIWFIWWARRNGKFGWPARQTLYAALANESEDEKENFRLLHAGGRRTPSLVVSAPED